MREMKYSGVEWIGDIPAEWSIIKFKFLHEGLNTGEAIGKEYWTEEETDTIFYTAGLVPIRTNYKDFPIWKYTSKNDLLMARNGTPYVYFPISGACYTDHIIRANMKESVVRKYVHYCLSQSISSVVANTVSIATWSASLWNEQIIPFPSDKEQQAIADVLDYKCTQIDALIANEEQQIAKLKAYKQSVITETVTKGLNPDVPMKDSGIEWIGEIPEHWKLERGKALFVEIESRSENGDEELLTVSQYTGITPRSQKNVNMFEASSLEGYKICEVGDIAANTMWMWAGAIGVSNYRGVISPSYNIYRQIHQEFNPIYLDFLLRIPPLVQCYESMSTGIRASRLRLYPKQFLNIFFLLPPIEEQQQIANYLNQKCEQIDRLIAIKQQKIEKLQQYKKSVIYEYVTGKREVE